jgi:hypothetical protein
VRLRVPRRVRRHSAEQSTWFEPSPLVWFEVVGREVRDFCRRR